MLVKAGKCAALRSWRRCSRRYPARRARRSVPAARTFALETLMEWGYRGRQDDMRLCVPEPAPHTLCEPVRGGVRPASAWRRSPGRPVVSPRVNDR